MQNRSVNQSSPFHPSNKPPEQYTVPEKIMEKPGHLDHRGRDTRNIAFSGKIGGLGTTILDDWRKAKHATNNDWVEQFKCNPADSPHKKPSKPITMKIMSENFERLGQGIQYAQ